MNRRRAAVYLGRLTWTCVIAAVAFLLFAWLLPQRLYIVWAPYRLAAVLSFFGRVFTFHLGLALAFAAIVAAALRRPRLAAMSSLSALIALAPTMWSYRPKTTPSVAGETIRVMSINLYAFSRNADDLLAQVRAADPDVLVLEEFTPFHEEVLQRGIGVDYPYQCLEARMSPRGLAVFSRIPLDAPVNVIMDGFRAQIRVVARIGQQRVAIYALHPRSPQSVWAVIVNRLETNDLLDQLKRETLPTILAGDFNFTETTANAAALRSAGLRSTHDLAGHGRGSTWPMLPRWRAWLPGVRIDHIFLTPSLTCTRDAVGGFDGSDHLPIYADIGLATGAKTIDSGHAPLAVVK
jgi:endonuclease/exonuclease/phosphatase (EEP) superfamily protein YafD